MGFAFFPDGIHAKGLDGESLTGWWKIRSIDTMKFSRDVAQEKRNDKSFDEIIKRQVLLAKDIGATHIAIATPYDNEFIPFMKRWVHYARAEKLNIWFRGNFSGWEEWFGYKKMTREEHKKQLKEFILNNSLLFEDGDLFTSCPECENGGPGDPRMTGDVEGFKRFLLEEYAIAKESFDRINKRVQANLYSMNGDVAFLIMDEEMTSALDGVVTIDHYVKTPEKMRQDLKRYADRSKGKIMIGEFGLPIPDIHGKLSEEAQASLLREFLEVFVEHLDVIGVNYWVSTGGSTELITIDGKRKKGISVLEEFYRPKQAFGIVRDELGKPLSEIFIETRYRNIVTDATGLFRLPLMYNGEVATVSSPYVHTTDIQLSEGKNMITLPYLHETFIFKVMKFLKTRFPFFFFLFYAPIEHT